MARQTPNAVPIVDIRRDMTDQSILGLVRSSLNPQEGQPRTMPTLVLYDEKGLKLFEQITYLEEYYPTNAEIETLETHANDIATRIPKGSRLVELGSGNLRKIDILLRAFEAAEKSIEYYALDLSLPELKRTFSELDTSVYRHVSFHGLHGTYDDALAWLETPGDRRRTTCLMSMGSSLGNFSPQEAAKFLSNFKNALQTGDLMFIGLDACQDPDRVFKAYNDSQRVTDSFYRNGLDHVNQLLGYELFKHDEWRVDGRYDEELNRHEAAYVALKTIASKEFSFEEGERIHFEDAFKYSQAESAKLWHDAGLVPQREYGNSRGDYFLHLLTPAIVNFSNKPSDYATNPVPDLDDWHQLWSAWDIVTKSMVPKEELANKPIKLRNDLIFYLGHIPTFADIHFTKATGDKSTDPTQYSAIFERGIDPDVDNPEVCHDHSEIPDTWPALNDILDYAHRVRTRITKSLESGRALKDRKLSRGLWLAYEHEAMHLETFLYMLLQSERVLSPPGGHVPDFKSLAADAQSKRVENQWHKVPASKIKVGLDDLENNDGPDRYFGWDNERPSRFVSVKEFEAQGRPISNGEYAYFLETANRETLPASWIKSTFGDHTNGVNGSAGVNGNHSPALKMGSPHFIEDKAVRTVYGPVPLKFALDWPIMASYDELSAYAEWFGGRIPTFEETRSIYNYVERNRSDLEKVPSKLISAVNGHLSNEGVEETPPSKHWVNGVVNGNSGPHPSDLFIDLSESNVGFKNFHPTSVTGSGDRLCGQGNAGGLWEWTSTPLAPFEGFKAMDLYPGYTADFFDDKHNICLGGSWATVPRIAGRRSFVNWYQRNYVYVWCTARLVRDIESA